MATAEESFMKKLAVCTCRGRCLPSVRACEDPAWTHRSAGPVGGSRDQCGPASLACAYQAAVTITSNSASHRRLHAFREQALVEIVERSFPAAGHGRRILEDGLHIMIMILIEPTNLLWFLGTLQLSGHVAVLRTVVRLDR
jgi:hypothetical protein